MGQAVAPCCLPSTGQFQESVLADDNANVPCLLTGQSMQKPDDEQTRSSMGADELLAIMNEVPLFRQIPPDQHVTLAKAFTKATYKDGDALYKRGDDGDEFFIIVDGTVSVAEKRKSNMVSKGGWVGLNALIRSEVRKATVTAVTKHVEVLMLKRCAFRKFGMYESLDFVRRHAVVAGSDLDIVTKPSTVKSAADSKVMTDALEANENLNSLYELNDSAINALVEVAWEEVVEENFELVTYGSTDTGYFYIVKTGKFEIMTPADNFESSTFSVQAALNSLFLQSMPGPFQSSSVASHRLGTQSYTLSGDNFQSQGFTGPGGSFGELALHYCAPHEATVIARQTSVVWVIDAHSFKRILDSEGDIAVKYAEYLQTSDVFVDLQRAEKMEIARNLNEASFGQGEHIIEQNTKGDTFYILTEGEIKFVKDDKEVKRFKATEDTVLIFGEKALLLGESSSLCPETVTVVSQAATALHMNKSGFEMLLAPLSKLQRRGLKGQCTVKSRRSIMKSACMGLLLESSFRLGEKIYQEDLTTLGLLGCGGFGLVELVEHKITKRTYAMKAVNKGYVVMKGMQQAVMHEKAVQMMCNSPFIVRIYETFNDYETLLFLLELLVGGELHRAYIRNEFYGSAAHCQYYMAGAVYALEHVHERNIVFRDLKPQNMLLSATGRMKLTDFGLAKVTVGKTYTTCGTAEYLAPEMCAGTGHTHAADWWAAGIVVFELMTGSTPFEGRAIADMFRNIREGMGKVLFPADMPIRCQDFIRALTRPLPTDRIPMKKGGIGNIKSHPWFRNFEWGALLDDTLEPPYKPAIRKKTDLADFAPKEEDMPPQLPYAQYDDGSGWDADFATSE